VPKRTFPRYVPYGATPGEFREWADPGKVGLFYFIFLSSASIDEEIARLYSGEKSIWFPFGVSSNFKY
jgi:hypothetical protein